MSNQTKLDEIFWPTQVRWWHETSCPAHSNNMRPESECDCLLGAVNEDLVAAKQQIKDLMLEIIGEDDHSEFGADDDTDYCLYRNELRAELRKKVSEL